MNMSNEIISKIKNEMMNINDTAILMRTNSQAIWFQKECILNNIPFYSKKKDLYGECNSKDYTIIH